MNRRKLSAGAGYESRHPVVAPGSAGGSKSKSIPAKTSSASPKSGFNYGHNEAGQGHASQYPPWESNNYRSPEHVARPLTGYQNIPENFHEYHFRSSYNLTTSAPSRSSVAGTSVSRLGANNSEFGFINASSPTRNWEHTGLGSLLNTKKNDPTLIGGGVRFTIMSYNILAPGLLDDHPELYKKCDSANLNWEFRLILIFKEIENYGTDIVCLQEVEDGIFHQALEPRFNAIGFRGVYKKKTRSKIDGCAIFYRTSKFLLIDKLDVELLQPHVPLLNRDNIGLLVKLETRNVIRRQKLVVGTTHLLFNPKCQDVKLAQTQLLLAELDRFAFSGFDRDGNTTYYPVLMTGDLNSKPYSSVTRLFCDGRLQYLDENGDLLKLLRRKGINTFIPQRCGISDQCQHYKIVLERYKRWRNQRTSNFELDLKSQESLVNLFPFLAARGYYESTATSDTCVSPPDDIISLLSPVTEAQEAPSVQDSVGVDLKLLEKAAEKVAMHANTNISNTPSTEQLIFPPDQHRYSHLERPVVEEINKCGLECDFATGVLQHNFKFRDIYGGKLDRPGKDHESVVTSKQSGWTCVDYIYQSMTYNSTFNKVTEGKLKLIRRLGLYTRNECKTVGDIPNDRFPSDHFPLVAEFLLRH